MRGPAPQPWTLTPRGARAVGALLLLALCFHPWGPS